MIPTFRNFDCNVILDTLDSNDVDLVIVDPPYGINESSKNFQSRNTPVIQKTGGFLNIKRTQYKKKDWDSSVPVASYFDKILKVSKNQIIFGANYFESICGNTFKPPRREFYDDFIKDYPIGWVIWDKVNGDNDFSDCELIWTSFDKPTIIIYYMWAGMMQGKSLKEGKVQQGNKKLNEKRIHPTQKPVIIYKFLLDRYSKEYDKILDTHGGSGSIAIACHDMKRHLVIFEIDTDIFNAMIKRYKQHVSQLRINF